MAFEQRDNRGALFKNVRKEQPTHSDYTGNLKVAGVEYWVNAWIKEGPKGKYFSLSVKPKLAVGGRRKEGTTLEDEMSDSIPF